MSEPREVDVWALADLCTPWCVHVVATLRIAELLETVPREVGELASQAGCDRDALLGVLRHLAGKGVFIEETAETSALNGPARTLLEPGARLGLDLDGFGGRMANAWTTLLTFIRTGKPAYETIFGAPFWEDLDRNTSIGELFDELMGPVGHGAPNPEVLLRAHE